MLRQNTAIQHLIRLAYLQRLGTFFDLYIHQIDSPNAFNHSIFNHFSECSDGSSTSNCVRSENSSEPDRHSNDRLLMTTTTTSVGHPTTNANPPITNFNQPMLNGNGMPMPMPMMNAQSIVNGVPMTTNAGQLFYGH